jgi:Fe-S-cluster-containing dehydrogenase component
MKILTTPRMERCIGCHSCSLACARLVHQRLSWDTAGIRIRSSGGLSTGFEATNCLACDPAPCVKVCPTGAYSQRKGGGVKVRIKLCIQCGDCAKACPVSAIYLDECGRPYVCIHCGRCVQYCPHDCLAYIEIPKEGSGEASREKTEAAA